MRRHTPCRWLPGVAGRRAGVIAPVGGGVLDQGEDPAGHEPRGPDRRPGTGDLADLDHTAAVSDVHPAAGPGRGHLVDPGFAARVDHDLDPVSLHAPSTCTE